MIDGAYKQLSATVALTASAATYYTVPSRPENAITVVHGIILCNTDSTARTVRVHNIASGGTAAASNAIIYDATIEPNTTEVFCFGDGVWIIPAGGFIQALASSASVVTITINGAEYVP